MGCEGDLRYSSFSDGAKPGFLVAHPVLKKAKRGSEVAAGTTRAAAAAEVAEAAEATVGKTAAAATGTRAAAAPAAVVAALAAALAAVVLAGLTLALAKVAAAMGTRAAVALPLALAAALVAAKRKRITERMVVGQSDTWLRWASGGFGQGPTPRQQGERHEALRFWALCGAAALNMNV